jgi:hypothetical protein
MDVRTIHRMLCAGVLLLGAGDAAAQILKCKEASGQVVYTQNSCPPGTQPLDLPEGVTSDPGSSFSPGSNPTRPLSPRGQQLQKKFQACMSSTSADCQEFQQLGQFCMQRANWDTADCAAMREVNSNFVNEMDRIGNNFKQRARENCSRDGDKKACDQVKCPLDMLMMEGTDAQVRACSKYRSLPSTATWAQVGESKPDLGAWEGEYVCLRLVHTQNPLGQNIAIRPFVNVNAVMDGGQLQGYKVRTKPRIKTLFATREEAVVAGCEAASGWWKELPDRAAGAPR